MRKFLALAFGICLFCFSCTKEHNAPPVNLEPEFYPLELGWVYIYDVDSANYDHFTPEFYKYQIKDSVADTFMDLTGATNYRIERYKRLNENSPWAIQQVFSRNKSLRAAEEFIGNQRFVRLIFPPKAGSVWNGNSKNTLGEQDYVIEAEVAPLQLNGFEFDSTVTVKEIDEFNLIEEDLALSVYAKHVGLVQKTVTSIGKNIENGKTTSGKVYSYKLVEIKKP
ncbi:hypothetical protein BCY91_13000 [Pelobium manganitolerans]|uniref:Uncharacterized protein n=1 Tax=Pelobium manganitolerans TaxID=1842495 RepID=A0A419SAN3_9SPHI|nr:hypothetical protein [Pelobium manganitolerans]RKD19516.1 hypothetical protein BCY91_13000 [Pelobium manganitolerans]